MERKHSDVLLAVLIFFGTYYWLPRLVRLAVDLDDISWLLACLVVAFVAGQVARRALPRLGFADCVIVAPIAMGLLAGLRLEFDERPFDLQTLLPIGISAVGALAAALTSRRRAETVARHWQVFAAGFASFGAGIFAGRIDMLVDDSHVALMAAIGAFVGSFLFAVFTPTTGRQCALGFGLISATATMADRAFFDGPDAVTSMLTAAIGGFVVGLIIAGVGGRIGDIFRREPDEEPKLPEAQIRRD